MAEEIAQAVGTFKVFYADTSGAADPAVRALGPAFSVVRVRPNGDIEKFEITAKYETVAAWLASRR